MKSIKMVFGGAGSVSVDWGNSVSGLEGVAQRAVNAVMTDRGTDKFVPGRGTDVSRSLLGYGAFDFLSMQHTLNFGGLKAVKDMQAYDEGRSPDAAVSNVRMSLLDVRSNTAEVAIRVTNLAGESTRQITQI